ncbi:MAG: hypothetical protein ACK5MR_17740 [Cumulibacter sp.]
MPENVNLGDIVFPVITMTNTGADRWGAGTSDTSEVQDVLKRMDIVADALDRSIKTSKIKMFRRRKNGSMKLAAENSSPDELTRQMMEDLDIIDYVDDPSIEGDSVKLSDRTLNAQE